YNSHSSATYVYLFTLLYYSPLSVSLLIHFFFQAEDGIRDRNVTGVQTCALPIFWNVTLQTLSNCMSNISTHTCSNLSCCWVWTICCLIHKSRYVTNDI